MFFATLGAHAAEMEKVRFCRATGQISSLPYIAEDQGFFKAQGLDVTFLTTTASKLCQDTLLGNQADISLIGEAPFAHLGFSAHTLRLLAKVGYNPVIALYARKDRGISVEKDIKGKTIAYLPGTVSYFYLAHLLDRVGLGFKDIKAVALQPPAMPQALAGGLIDGFVIWIPWGHMAMAAMGDKVVRLYDPSIYKERSFLVATDSSAKNHPAIVTKVLKALMQAETYIYEHPAEAKKLIAHEINISEQIEAEFWPEIDFRIKLDKKISTLLADDAHYITRDDPNFKDKPIPDYSRFIDASFLGDVAPERVQP
jgi:ABC-type nitrate/sulfonate/bicarbonate transport system substrate-binding protein